MDNLAEIYGMPAQEDPVATLKAEILMARSEALALATKERDEQTNMRTVQ